MSSEEIRRPLVRKSHATDIPHMGVYFGKSPELVWVTCATKECNQRLKVKKARANNKKPIHCALCEHKIARESARQDVIAAEVARRSQQAKDKRRWRPKKTSSRI